MCWYGKSFNICYDCAREFNHKTHKIPCVAANGVVEKEEKQKEKGKGRVNVRVCLVEKRLQYPVIRTEDNCAECKASRVAEEECQRRIYRLRPLHLPIAEKSRMRVLTEAYR